MVIVTVLRAKNCSTGCAAPSPAAASSAAMARLQRNATRCSGGRCDTGGPIPKFVSTRGAFRCQLRDPRTTGLSMILGRVPINRDRERTSMLRSGMSEFVPGADIAGFPFDHPVGERDQHQRRFAAVEREQKA